MQIANSKITVRPTKVYFLKMEQRPAGSLSQNPDVSFRVLPKPLDVDEYLNFYRSVGLKFNWLDRLFMKKEELDKKINAHNVHIHIMSVRGEDAGFLELVEETDHVELLYFGLYPSFIGKGYGKYFLDWSIQTAWAYNPKWIQLNTCELDHVNALPVYRKLGFKDYKTTIEDRRVLVEPIQ